MKAVGLDLGTSSTKGAAIEVFEDGSSSVLEVFSIRTSDLSASISQIAAAVNRNRPSPFMHPRIGLSLSHPDIFFDRVRLQLPAETRAITEQEIKTMIFQEKIAAPGGTKPAEDLWDFQVLSLRRRSTDITEFGMKSAEGLFVRIPRAAYDSAGESLKGIQAGHITPSLLSLLDFVLRFPQPENQGVMFLDLGTTKIDALVAVNGEIMRTCKTPLTGLSLEIGTHARITDPRQIEQRLRDADVLASNSVDTAIKSVISASLQKIRAWLNGDEAANPSAVQRVVLCGGMASVTGMVRLANSILNIHCELLSQPEQVRTSLPSFSSELPLYANAIGAAFRAAGAASFRLEPRRVSLKKAAVHEKEDRIHEAGPAELHGVAGTASGAEGIGVTDFKDLAARLRSSAVHAFTSLRKTAREIPSRLGVAWIVMGAVAGIAIVPTIMLYRAEGRQIRETVRDMRRVAPGSVELARQARLIEEYKSILKTGALDLLPWGEVIKDTTAIIPSQAFVTSIRANRERMLVVGRVTGNITQHLNRIAEKMRESPILSRQGLIPPVF